MLVSVNRHFPLLPLPAIVAACLAAILGCADAAALSIFQAPSCSVIDVEDAKAAAKASIRRNDLSAFPRYVGSDDFPAIFCPAKQYRKISRQPFKLDDPACRFALTEQRAEAYNTALSSSSRFQEATGCRTATYCETLYTKREHTSRKIARLDPACPNEPIILRSIAQFRTTDDLRNALALSDTASPEGIDMLTAALTTAFSAARWDSAAVLIEAGADVDGRPHSAGQQAIAPWMDSPLVAIFGHGNRFFGDPSHVAAELNMAKWLFERGASFGNPRANVALIAAASNGNFEGALFLLRAGASPNGAVSTSELDRLAQADIGTASHDYDYSGTAFYAALEGALRVHQRQTPAERSWADDEERKAKMLAVRFLEAGGRFMVANIYGNAIYEDPDIDVISILLTAAHREGRLAELAERMIEGLEGWSDKRDLAEPRNAAVTYIRSVLACPAIRPRPAVDHMELCG